MNIIVVDHETKAKLGGASADVEVRDDSGRLLGYFFPADSRSLYDQIEIPISDEELDRISKEGGGRPLREILADLERSE